MKFMFSLNNKTSDQRLLRFFILGLGILLLVSGFSLLYIKTLLKPVDLSGKAAWVSIRIPQQTSSDEISKILYQAGLTRIPKIFTYYSRYKGVDSQLKAGDYVLSARQSLPEIVGMMVEGPSDKIVFTIPEGYNTRQVAELLERQGLVDKERFYHEISAGSYSYDFLKQLPQGRQRLEGYLFPETYAVGSTTSERVIVDMMLKCFEDKLIAMDYREKLNQTNLTLHEAVTIASMIEREARINEERPLIAGVIFNRLRLGMPLQIDATVEYALGSHRSKIYYKDLEIDSPYNTYKIQGLPPGPIAAPGEASLLAVLNPAKTDYLYYVAKSDGSHAFAKTLTEHNANKAKYLR